MEGWAHNVSQRSDYEPWRRGQQQALGREVAVRRLPKMKGVEVALCWILRGTKARAKRKGLSSPCENALLEFSHGSVL